MANFGNPMDYFNAGITGGQVGSPAYGVGNAIRNVLDQANKKGLIQAQTQGNLDTSIAATYAKQNAEKAYDSEEVEHLVVNPNTGQIIKIKGPRGQKPIVGGSQPNINMVLGEMMGDKGEGTPGLSIEDQYAEYLNISGNNK